MSSFLTPISSPRRCKIHIFVSKFSLVSEDVRYYLEDNFGYKDREGSIGKLVQDFQRRIRGYFFFDKLLDIYRRIQDYFLSFAPFSHFRAAASITGPILFSYRFDVTRRPLSFLLHDLFFKCKSCDSAPVPLL